MATANERIIQMVQSGQITPQQADQLFTQAGINVTAGGGARTRFLQENPQANQRLMNMLSAFGGGGQGAMPIGIEPLHRGEIEGYETMLNRGLLGGGGMVEGQQRIRDFIANPQAASANYMSPEAIEALRKSLGMYDKADASVAQGIAPIQSSDFERYQNPLQSQVIDMALARLADDYEKAKDERFAELNSRPSASFGDMFGATKMAELAKENMRTRAEIPVQVGYRGWQDTLAALQGEKNRFLEGGQIYGGLGSGLGNIGTQAQNIQQSAMTSALTPIEALYQTGVIGTGVSYEAADRKIAAGQNIRRFNQGLADITMNDYMASRQFPRENLAQTMQIVPSFATQNYNVQGMQQPAPNAVQGAGQFLSGLGGVQGINNTAVGRWFGGL